MATEPAKDQVPPAFWQIVSPSDYKLPSAPVKLMDGKRFASLWRLFRSRPAQPSSPLNKEKKLRDLPQEWIERFAPDPEWSEAAAALNDDFEPLFRGKHKKSSPIFLLCPPRSGHANILTSWAEMRQWRVVDPPSPETIFEGDRTWQSHLTEDSGPWVLPHLEGCYFRHVRGLALIRHIMQIMDSGLAGQAVIGCDSWAWAFFRLLWKGPAPSLFCLQAFDQELLTAYLQRKVAAGSGDRFQFRQSDNGQWALPPPSDAAQHSPEISTFIKELAAYSRGIPAIALSMWRAALRITEDGNSAGESVTEDHRSGYRRIWLKAWDEMEVPVLPEGAGRDHAFALHALLLHNGLQDGLIQDLLPLSSSRVAAVLSQLEAAGMIEREQETWQVTASSYPPVRRFLSGEDYLTDQF
jgi:hypothetical protein